ncbi:MAG: DUF615 domain-containing protein [Lysobacteraceae bacterium]|nr:MAG: DUF615 domain-containing protein [Xanthomonadaceae bacterium]
MRGRDEDNGETTHGSSRSEARRAALDVLALGERLAALPPARLAKLPVPEALLPHIAETRRMASHGARKRQLGFLAKQMRREDPEALDAIRDALDAGGEASRRETALLHRAEAARTQLLEGGDEALTAFLETHPGADFQRLRQLLRNAAEEQARGKPPRAYRELFRELRGLLEEREQGTGNGEQDVKASGE